MAIEESVEELEKFGSMSRDRGTRKLQTRSPQLEGPTTIPYCKGNRMKWQFGGYCNGGNNE